MAQRGFLTHSKRSFTNHHDLLPNRGQSGDTFVSPVPTNRFSAWTFGRGTVIWRIWPAVLLHTCVAAVVVFVSYRTPYNLAIPNVLVTVAGVVIGFVISYRASSGYDRYWQGRTMWSDLIRNARTISRLIWLHVPNTISKPDTKPSEKEKAREAKQVVNEKRIALGLVEGFAIALKHHLRGEPGIYYEDLYYLVTTVPHVSKHFQTNSPTVATFAAGPSTSTLPEHTNHQYGTFRPALDTDVNGLTSFPFPSPPSPTPSEPLLPGNRPPPTIPTPSRSLLPFTSLVVPFTALLGLFSWAATKTTKSESGHQRASSDPEQARGPGQQQTFKQHKRNVRRKFTVGRKYYPLVAGESELNLPLAILRRLSEWVAVLEARGSSGVAIGGIMGCISTFEDQLSGLERILTTPLPFVYSVHIRHTVWLYLFFLPFQLTDTFGYWTIFGVGIAAFMFLGLLAAGEEIEQPFGYDENDLDLDLFISEILHRDLQTLMDMWPYHTQELNGRTWEQGDDSSGASEIRRVVDAPVDLGDEIGVNEEGRVEGTARMAGRVDEI
ncbi:bestrophin protein [Ceratobasidium sp. AG-Ba]|nr:bestrophin protein [Ceratobasidium sp. AG-Ba]